MLTPARIQDKDEASVAASLPVRTLTIDSVKIADSVAIDLRVLGPQISRTLRSVRILSTSFWHHPSVFVDIIRPLLKIPQIEDAQINLMHQQFRFTDTHLSEVATAWPRIVNLSLAFRICFDDAVPHFLSIGRVNRLCASLETLALPAMELQSSDDLSRLLPFPSSHLVSLAIRSLRQVDNHNHYSEFADDSSGIAGSIRVAFPKLQKLRLREEMLSIPVSLVFL